MRLIAFTMIVALFSPISRGQESGFKIRGSVVNINGRPLGRVNVSLNSKRGTVTDTSGTFSFTDLPPGRYSLQATGGGFNPVLAQGLDVSRARPVLTLRIQMEVGALACPLTPGLAHYFRLLEAAGDKELSAFRGTITDEHGVSIPGAAVALYIPKQGQIASTHAGSDGSFSFTSLKVDRDYWIQVSSDGYFVGEFTSLETLPGYESVYDSLTLEACEPRHCDPALRKTQTLRCE